jgi:Asp-tRNA(Asn)/Glu-tRNA(Gln) amidotransferase C subunit
MKTQSKDKYKRALADISIAVAELEQSIMRCIMYMTNQPWQLVLCILGSDSFDVLIRKLEKVVFYFVNVETVNNDFSEIKKSLSKINEKRNTYVHSMWHFAPSNEVLRLKYKKRFSAGEITDYAIVDLNELRAYLAEISNTEERLTHFIELHIADFNKIAKKKYRSRKKYEF